MAWICVPIGRRHCRAGKFAEATVPCHPCNHFVYALTGIERYAGPILDSALSLTSRHWTDELIRTIAIARGSRYVDMPLQHIHR